MNNRIKQLRQALALSQKEFAQSIGIRQSAISMIENGTMSITDRNINTICLSFGVSESWLRTGEGEMFPPPPEEDDELIEAFGFLTADDVDPWKKRLAKAFLELLSDIPDEAIPHLRRFLSDASAAMEEKKDED